MAIAPKFTPLLLALGLTYAALGSACRRAPPPEGSKPGGVERGDAVVVERAAADFFEGRVLELEPKRLKVQPALGGASVWVERDDVYPTSSKQGKVERPAPGAFAICQGSPQVWVPCRIERAEGAGFVARDASRRELLLLNQEGALKPTQVTELNVRHHFEHAEAEQKFRADTQRFGEPRRPKRWIPIPHAKLIARRDGGWYSAEVFEYSEQRPRVRFFSDGRITELDVSQLAPEPPYDTRDLRRGDFILVRPSAPTEDWEPAQIRSISEEGFRIADAEGNSRQVSVHDIIVLEAADAGPSEKP